MRIVVTSRPGHLARAFDALQAASRTLNAHRSLAGFILAACALFSVLSISWLELFRHTPHQLVTAITVKVNAGETATLDRARLAALASSGDLAAFTYDSVRGLRLRASSLGESIWVRPRGQDYGVDVRNLVLTEAMVVAVGALKLTVVSAESELAFDDALGRRWTYDGRTLTRPDGGALTCPNVSLPTRLIERWNRSVMRSLAFQRPLEIGGIATCGNRMAGTTLSPRSVLIRRDGSVYRLTSSSAEAARATRYAEKPTTTFKSLLDQDVAVNDIERITVGKSSYRVAVEVRDAASATVMLTPTGRTSKVTEDEAPKNAQVSWSLAAANPGNLPSRGVVGGLLVGFGAMVAGYAVLAHQRRRERLGKLPVAEAGFAALCMALLGWGLLARILGSAVGSAWSLGLFSFACISFMIYASRMRSWPMMIALLLAAIGMASQLKLGLSAAHTAGIMQMQTLAAAVALALGALGLAGAAFKRLWTFHNSTARTELLLGIVAISSLGGLASQVLFGDELGVGGVQPVEWVKMSLVILTAHFLAVRLGWVYGGYQTAAWRLWLRVIAPLLLVLGLIAVSLYLLHDFSPFVLLVFWMTGVTLAYLVAANRAALALGLTCVGVISAAWVMIHPNDVLRVLDAADLYGDRIRVWTSPELYPFSGDQWFRGTRLAAEGGWRGRWSDDIAQLGVWRVPAIQDDFAPSLLLLLFGRVGAALVWTLEALLIAALLWRGTQHLQVARSITGDYRRQWWHHSVFLVLWGGAGFMLAHMVIAWGTNLGFTPVMGQPLTFISAAGSHLIFLALPICMVGSLPITTEAR